MALQGVKKLSAMASDTIVAQANEKVNMHIVVKVQLAEEGGAAAYCGAVSM